MKWLTRQRPQVDRIACPWLIQRFGDPAAEFLYVPADQVLVVAEREGATAFDVPGAELGHHGDECSFDAIVRNYDLASANPALGHLARIVRGADTANHDLAHVEGEPQRDEIRARVDALVRALASGPAAIN